MKTRLILILSLMMIFTSCSLDTNVNRTISAQGEIGGDGSGSQGDNGGNNGDQKDPPVIRLCLHPDASNFDEECEEGMGWCYFYLCMDSAYQEFDQEKIDEYNDYIASQQGGAIFHSPDLCVNKEKESIAGCKEPLATNTNPEATVDDGSCEFVACNQEGTVGYLDDLEIRKAHEAYKEIWQDEAADLIHDEKRCGPKVSKIPGCLKEDADNYDQEADYPTDCMFSACYESEYQDYENYIDYDEFKDQIAELCQLYPANCQVQHNGEKCGEKNDGGEQIVGCMIDDARVDNYDEKATKPGVCKFSACFDLAYQGSENEEEFNESIEQLCKDYPALCKTSHNQDKCGEKKAGGGDDPKLRGVKGILTLEHNGKGGFYAGGVFKLDGSSQFIQLVEVAEDLETIDVAVAQFERLNGSEAVIHDLKLVGRTLYIAGFFELVNGQPRQNIAAINIETNELTDFNVVNNSAYIKALEYHDNTLYFGGKFSQVNGQLRDSVAGVNLNSGQVANLNLRFHGLADKEILALAVDQSRGVLHIGGKFHGVTNYVQNAANVHQALASVSLRNNSLIQSSLYPKFDTDQPGNHTSGAIHTLHYRNNHLYVGGVFNKVADGLYLRNFTSVSTVTWVADADFDLEITSSLHIPIPSHLDRSRISSVVTNRSGSGLYFAGAFEGACRSQHTNIGLAKTYDKTCAYQAVQVPYLEPEGVISGALLKLESDNLIIGVLRDSSGALLLKTDDQLMTVDAIE